MFFALYHCTGIPKLSCYHSIAMFSATPYENHSPLLGSDSDDDYDSRREQSVPTFQKTQWRQIFKQFLWISYVFLFLIAVFSIFHSYNRCFQSNRDESPSVLSTSCTRPVIRKEWRSLSHEEQERYISAVQCLRTQPSRIGLAHSLYDDFPWTHSRIGNYCISTLKFFSKGHLIDN